MASPFGKTHQQSGLYTQMRVIRDMVVITVEHWDSRGNRPVDTIRSKTKFRLA